MLGFNCVENNPQAYKSAHCPWHMVQVQRNSWAFIYSTLLKSNSFLKGLRKKLLKLFLRRGLEGGRSTTWTADQGGGGHVGTPRDERSLDTLVIACTSSHVGGSCCLLPSLGCFPLSVNKEVRGKVEDFFISSIHSQYSALWAALALACSNTN